jgi:hypothetical protein
MVCEIYHVHSLPVPYSIAYYPGLSIYIHCMGVELLLT